MKLISLYSSIFLKDLGDLKLFLKVEVLYTNDVLILSQSKYIVNLFRKHNMSNIKRAHSLHSTIEKLRLQDGLPAIDPSRYRQIISAFNISPSPDQVSLCGELFISFHAFSYYRTLAYC